MPYRNVLLIDDDEDDQEIFITAATALSADIICKGFLDATRALEMLSLRSISHEVIFLDLNMPLMNGKQFLTEIKRSDDLRHIPVIIYSTSSHPQTIRSVMDLGADGFITKPGSFDELVNLLKPLLM